MFGSSPDTVHALPLLETDPLNCKPWHNFGCKFPDLLSILFYPAFLFVYVSSVLGGVSMLKEAHDLC